MFKIAAKADFQDMVYIFLYMFRLFRKCSVIFRTWPWFFWTRPKFYRTWAVFTKQVRNFL